MPSICHYRHYSISWSNSGPIGDGRLSVMVALFGRFGHGGAAAGRCCGALLSLGGWANQPGEGVSTAFVEDVTVSPSIAEAHALHAHWARARPHVTLLLPALNFTPIASLAALAAADAPGGSGNPRQRKLPCTLEAHVSAKVLNCARTRTLIVTSSSPSSSPSSPPSSSQDNEAGPSAPPPVPLGAAAGTTINTMPPITSDGLHELIDEMFPEVADVWSFLTEEDDDLMVEWARYNNN